MKKYIKQLIKLINYERDAEIELMTNEIKNLSPKKRESLGRAINKVKGKYLGKHKFSEISPKKTIEGCIGGLIGAVLFVLIYTAFLNKVFNTNISYILMTSYAIIWSILGQIGDFAASTIKRYTGIKDYSNLLPGHGGMLDRFDSVIFIAPFAYILLMLI